MATFAAKTKRGGRKQGRGGRRAASESYRGTVADVMLQSTGDDEAKKADPLPQQGGDALMDTHLPRQNAKLGKLPTLADLRERIPLVTTRTWAARKGWLQAVDRISAILNRPAEGIPLELATLNAVLRAVNPVSAHCTVREISELRRLLVGAGTATGLLSVNWHVRELMPCWHHLRGKLPDARSRDLLPRLMYFASQHGLAPQDVDNSFFQTYAKDLETSLLRGGLQNRLRRTAIVWNGLAERNPDLGLRQLNVPPHRRRLTRIKIRDLPCATFAAELREYLSWAASSDTLDHSTRRRALRPRSISTIECQVEAALTALIKSGYNAEEIVSLRALVTPKNLRRILNWWESRNGRASYARSMANALIQIARDWIKVSSKVLTELREIASLTHLRDTELSARGRIVLRRLEDPVFFEQFKQLPKRLFEEAFVSGKENDVPKAQTAIALRIMRFAPLKRKALTDLAFDREIALGTAPGSPSELRISEKEAVPIPDDVVVMLRAFRDELCPRALGFRPQHLFCGPNGRLKTDATVRYLLMSHTEAALGLALTPDILRVMTGYMILKHNPKGHGLVKAALGHRTAQSSLDRFRWLREHQVSDTHQARIEKQLRARRRVGQRRRA